MSVQMHHHHPVSNYCGLLLVLLLISEAAGVRIFFEKCDYKGFTCVKSTKLAGKYDILFGCNNITGFAIEFYLWQFRAPASITSLKISNCTSMNLNLICTSESRAIQTLHVSNITNLSIVQLESGLALSAPEMIFQDIETMDTVPYRTFQQVKRLKSLTKFGCITPYGDLESVRFENVNLDSLEREAFHNLTEMKRFEFVNVTIDTLHAAAIQVFLDSKAEMKIHHCKFGIFEYHAIYTRGPKFSFLSNQVNEIRSSAINATVNDFYFMKNSIGWIHPVGLSVLAQNIKIIDSSFDYLSSGAFLNIGPGLPENSLRSFGHLKFFYEFNNNLIEALEVASLHPDWRAYQNVGSSITISYNALQCSCAELAWLGMQQGYGRDFSHLQDFHNILLKVDNKNICMDAPCILPIQAVRLMVLRDGRCLNNITLQYLCGLYYPKTPSTTPSTTPPFLYQKQRITGINYRTSTFNTSPRLFSYSRQYFFDTFSLIIFLVHILI